MSAAAAVSGAAWTSLLAGLVFLALFGLLALDRAHTKRRLAAVERSEALLETELADARREISALRDCLRGPADPAGSGGLDATRLGVTPVRDPAAGGPTSAFG